MSLEQILRSDTLLALPDVHSSPLARVTARNLINKGLVQRFFIEWNTDAEGRDKKLLNNVLAKLVGASFETVMTELKNGYFRGLSGDAKPNLPELAALAASRGAQVVAMDMDPKKVIDAIEEDEALHQGGMVSMSWLFGPTGLKVRDEFAGSQIARFLLEGPQTTGRLMLWGANHFEPDGDFKKGLADIIRDYRLPPRKNLTKATTFQDPRSIDVYVARDSEMKE
jgi:hypothetical protein